MNGMFDPDCQRCPRLVAFLNDVKARFPSYHCRPVEPFGVGDARLLIVGLAPGMHGANATGRPFTGDHAGILLYRTLFHNGFATAPESVSHDDGLQLVDCRITNAVKCLPPENKPTGDEVKRCNPFLREELLGMQKNGVVLALGGVAHRAVIAALGLKQVEHRFAHGAEFVLPNGCRLLDSYHCSRYNTQTNRLTPEMFQAVFSRARELLDKGV